MTTPTTNTNHGGADAPPPPIIAAGLAFLGAYEGLHLRLVGAGILAGVALVLSTMAIVLWRRRPVARLRRAFRDLGLVHRAPDGCTVEMRKVGLVKRDGRNKLIRWSLPPGVTLDDVRRNEEAIGHRTVCAVSTWMERGLLHMEVLGHPIPDHVAFPEFYGIPRELLGGEPHGAGKAPKGDLVIGLGRGHRGPLWADLALLPHLLVGGITGGGKSVFLRQLLTGLAVQYGPDRLRLVLIDLKGGVELAHFANLPHTKYPVADDAEAAACALGMVRAELDRRLTLLRGAGIASVGGEGAAELPRELRLPRIVVVVDEVAELTLGHLTGAGAPAARSANKEATGRLGEIARLGRAVGIHLVVCTQRPDAEAVPGQLKANLAATVAFRVRAGVNSQILVGDDRAAKLPPRPGRGLWSFDRGEEFQSVYISEADSRSVLFAKYGRWEPGSWCEGHTFDHGMYWQLPVDGTAGGGGVHVTRRPQSPRIQESCINGEGAVPDASLGEGWDDDSGEERPAC